MTDRKRVPDPPVAEGAQRQPIGQPEPEEICEYAGHEWVDAGGGLLICLRCEAEKWDDE